MERWEGEKEKGRPETGRDRESEGQRELLIGFTVKFISCNTNFGKVHHAAHILLALLYLCFFCYIC